VLSLALAAGALALVTAPAAASVLGPRAAHSPNADDIRTAYWVAIIVAALLIVAVHVFLIGALLRYRARRGRSPQRFTAGARAFVRPVVPLVAVVVGLFVFGIAPTILVAMILAIAYAFDPLLAIVCSLLGCLASAIFLYAIGYQLGRKNVVRFAGRRLNRINRLISKHGALAVAAVRMLPVAPYSMVNLAAGAVHVPFRDFVFGTFLGMSPGVLGITLLESQLEQTIESPSAMTLAILGGTLLIMLAGIFGFRRWFAGRKYPRKLREPRVGRAAESS